MSERFPYNPLKDTVTQWRFKESTGTEGSVQRFVSARDEREIASDSMAVHALKVANSVVPEFVERLRAGDAGYIFVPLKDREGVVIRNVVEHTHDVNDYLQEMFEHSTVCVGIGLQRTKRGLEYLLFYDAPHTAFGRFALGVDPYKFRNEVALYEPLVEELDEGIHLMQMSEEIDLWRLPEEQLYGLTLKAYASVAQAMRSSLQDDPRWLRDQGIDAVWRTSDQEIMTFEMLKHVWGMDR